MFQDLLTFLETLPEQSLHTGEKFLPDSFDIYIERVQTYINQFDDTYKMIGAVVSLVLALLVCFFGYKFSRIFMSITGFIAGALLGYGAATQIFNLTGPALIAVVVVAGIIIGAMASWIYLAGIFILCFVLAFTAAATLLPFSGDIQFFLCALFHSLDVVGEECSVVGLLSVVSELESGAGVEVVVTHTDSSFSVGDEYQSCGAGLPSIARVAPPSAVSVVEDAL